MIRTGSTSSGVSSILNSFHAQVLQSGEFFTNVGGGSPPPTLSKVFASDSTGPPLFRLGGTVFVDPYGFGTLPSTVSTLYFNAAISGSVGLDVSWANSYSGTANALYPEGTFQDIADRGTEGQGFYIRVRNSSRPYRIFFYENSIGSKSYFSVIGPENISKVAPVSGGFQMSGLKGASLGRILCLNSSFYVRFEKSERVIDTIEGTIWEQKVLWTERGLVNSNPEYMGDVYFYFFR